MIMYSFFCLIYCFLLIYKFNKKISFINKQKILLEEFEIYIFI